MTKKLYIFAGVNGAGKSTLYNTEKDNIELKESVRINTDEIVRTFGNWKNSLDQLKAAKIAITLRNKCLEEGKSFNEETTLTGKTILKMIDKAKKLNYKIYLYYIGLENPEIAKERVKNRVLKGGHNIPENIIEKRYYESIENLEKIINKCDEVRIFDNSIKNKAIFISDHKKNSIIEHLPKWAEKSICKRLKSIENPIKKKEIKKNENTR